MFLGRVGAFQLEVDEKKAFMTLGSGTGTEKIRLNAEKNASFVQVCTNAFSGAQLGATDHDPGYQQSCSPFVLPDSTAGMQPRLIMVDPVRGVHVFPR